MDAVVGGEGEPFRLVGKQPVMSALLSLVEKDSVHRGVRVIRAEQSIPTGKTMPTAEVTVATARDGGHDNGCHSGGNLAERVSCRVLVGADGIQSVCRVAVPAATATLPALHNGADGVPPTSSGESPAVRAADARDGGEVCHSGVLDLKHGSPAAEAGLRTMFDHDEERRPSCTSVVYGERILFSWGFIDGAREAGYYFVKQLTGKGRHNSLGEGWPEPLRTFVELAGKKCSYPHRIQDRPPLQRWSCRNIALLGNACHPAASTSGQEASMAIEDALVLATLLGEPWEKPDGHIEAFYLYEGAPSPYQESAGQFSPADEATVGLTTGRPVAWLRKFILCSRPPEVLQEKLRAANQRVRYRPVALQVKGSQSEEEAAAGLRIA